MPKLTDNKKSYNKLQKRTLLFLPMLLILVFATACGSSVEEDTPTTTKPKSTTTTEAIDQNSYEGLCQKIRDTKVEISDTFSKVGQQLVSDPKKAVTTLQNFFTQLAPELEEIRDLVEKVEIPPSEENTEDNIAEVKDEMDTNLDELTLLMQQISSKLSTIPEEEQTIENLTNAVQEDLVSFSELSVSLAKSIAKLNLDTCYESVEDES